MIALWPVSKMLTKRIQTSQFLIVLFLLVLCYSYLISDRSSRRIDRANIIEITLKGKN